MSARADATVLVIGMGDLGRRVLDAVVRLPVARVVAAGRDGDQARGLAAQGALVAALAGGAGRVEPLRLDLDDPEATARALAAIEPTVIVTSASRHTWWRTPPALAAVPYGAWLSMHVGPVRAVMEARAAAAPGATVVCLPYPDAVGPVLAGVGLAPELGAGNVLEVAAKLEVLAAADAAVDRSAVEVRLVAHHAAERYAFGAFESLGSPDAPAGRPPVRAEITVSGRRLPDDRVRAMFSGAYPLGGGRETHGLTAAATGATVAALLGSVPERLHAPAPGGRPGGYPVRLSASRVALDLPAGLTEADAVAVNAVAARWDGIERIDADGTTTFTEWATDTIERALGVRLARVAVDEHDAVADELAAALAAARAAG